MDRVNIEMIEHQQHRTHSKAWLKKDANNTNDLDDSKKIQIESVDSSLRDESVYIPEEKTSDLKENNSRLMRTERKQREIDAKQQAAKYKKRKSKKLSRKSAEDSDADKSTSTSSSSLSLNLATTNKRHKNDKQKQESSKKSRPRQKPLHCSASDLESGSDSCSKSRSSSHSSSVSDLLSDSASSEQTYEINQTKSLCDSASENDSSDYSSVSNVQRKSRSKKSRHTKRVKTPDTNNKKPGNSRSSSGRDRNGASSAESDECSDQTDSEEKCKRYGSSSGGLKNDQLNKILRKCQEYESELRKSLKKLKFYKQRKQMSSSSKMKARIDLKKKRVLKRKKKLQSKLNFYQSMLESNRHQWRQKSSGEVKHSYHHHQQQQIDSESGGRSHSSGKMKEHLDEPYERDGHAVSMNQHDLQGSSNLKLPYPVLNDNRDMRVVLTVLKDKQAHLSGMLEQTLSTLNNLGVEGGKESFSVNTRDDLEKRRCRLKTLEENIKVQLTRLGRQIDFINYKLDISKIGKMLEKCENLDEETLEEEMCLDYEKIDQMKRKLNEQTKKMDHLLTLMRDANTRFLKQQDYCKPSSQKSEKMTTPNQNLPSNSNDFRKSYNFPVSTQNQKSEKATSSALPFNYYRSVPPPGLANSDVQDKKCSEDIQSSTRQQNKSTHINPNHNIQKIIKESADFNTQMRSANNSAGAKSSSNPDPNSHQPPTTHKTYHARSKSPLRRDPSISPSLATTSQITPESDPKAIAAMLNKKYGYKKTNDPKKSDDQITHKPSRNSAKRDIRPDTNSNPDYNQMRLPSNQSSSFNTTPSNQLSSFNTNSVTSNLEAMLANSLPKSMTSSPAFMSTMSSMLQSMGQQGVNVNTIMNQMPNILSGIDLTNKNQGFKSDNFRGAPFNQSDPSNSGYSGGTPSYSSYPGDSLLPNPSASVDEERISKAFCSYISNFSQEMVNGLSGDLSLGQINKMLNESGIMDNFKANYNVNSDQIYQQSHSNSTNWNNYGPDFQKSSFDDQYNNGNHNNGNRNWGTNSYNNSNNNNNHHHNNSSNYNQNNRYYTNNNSYNNKRSFKNYNKFKRQMD